MGGHKGLCDQLLSWSLFFFLRPLLDLEPLDLDDAEDTGLAADLRAGEFLLGLDFFCFLAQTPSSLLSFSGCGPQRQGLSVQAGPPLTLCIICFLHPFEGGIEDAYHDHCFREKVMPQNAVDHQKNLRYRVAAWMADALSSHLVPSLGSS